MKAITSEETKKKLLEQLKRAVCIEQAFWSTCFFIEALLDDKCDAITRILQVGGPLGRVMVVIVGAIAELERSLIVERVKAECAEQNWKEDG